MKQSVLLTALFAGIAFVALLTNAFQPFVHAQSNDGVYLKRFPLTGSLAGLVRHLADKDDMKFSGFLALMLGLNPQGDPIWVKSASFWWDHQHTIQRDVYVTTVRDKIDVIFGVREGVISRFYVTSTDGYRVEIAKVGHMSGGNLELKDMPASSIHDGFEQEKAAWLDWLSTQSTVISAERPGPH